MFYTAYFTIIKSSILKDFKMKRILYATDFSKNAEKAFHFALRIAEKHNAELIMLHIYDVPPVWDPNPTLIPAEIIKKAGISWENKLRKLFESLNSKLRPVYIAIEDPSVVKGILSVVKKQKPDLLVTGTRGKSKLKEIFIGSTTKALVKKSPVPVLAIPENAVFRGFDKVLYASDLREIDHDAIDKLIEFITPYKSEIRITHVTNDNEYHGIEKMEWFKDLIQENVSYKKISFELLLSDDIYDSLINYMTIYDPQLLVMLEKERNGFVERLFKEDIVTKMEFDTSIPLLSYNERFLHVNMDEPQGQTEDMQADI